MSGDAAYRSVTDLRNGEIVAVAPKSDATSAAVSAIRMRIGTLFNQASRVDSVDHLARADRLRHALYAIADLTNATATDLSATLGALHRTSRL